MLTCSGAKELFLHIHPALLKNFIPHLFSREGETVVDKRGRAVQYLLPADNMVFPWMKQVNPYKQYRPCYNVPRVLHVPNLTCAARNPGWGNTFLEN